MRLSKFIALTLARRAAFHHVTLGAKVSGFIDRKGRTKQHQGALARAYFNAARSL